MKKLVLYSLAAAFAGLLPSLASAAVVYTNGPINGQEDAYLINDGDSVTDSFTIVDGATLATANVGLWVSAGDTPTLLTWGIGTTPFGTDISTGTSTPTNVFNDSAFGGGFDVYSSTFSLSGVLPGAGTYYLTLSNAAAARNGFVFWDENDGPSTAQQIDDDGDIFSIASESFTLNAVPEPSTWAMLGLGVAGMGALVLRRRTSVA